MTQATNALYVFGIVDGSQETESVVRRGSLPPSFPVPGIFVIPVQDLGAVVRTVDAVSFSGEELTKLKSPEWLREQILLHESVLEHVMSQGPVVPFRFASLFFSPERLAQVLEPKYEEIKRLLSEFSGKEEWSVRVEADPERFAQWVRAHVDFGKFSLDGGEGMACSEGTRYLLQRQHQLALGEASERWFQQYREAMLSEVARFSQRIVPMDCVDNRSFFSISCLIPRELQTLFGSTLAKLGEHPDWEPVEVKISGPFPPYSFCETMKE